MSSLADTSRAGDKYETVSTSNGYIKHMRLKIRNVGPNDFGNYRCVAKNSLGETDGLIKLDGEYLHTESSTVTCSVVGGSIISVSGCELRLPPPSHAHLFITSPALLWWCGGHNSREPTEQSSGQCG